MPLFFIGFCVVAFDHRGMGKSEGIRGRIDNISTHINDAMLFIEEVEKIYKNEKKVPKFLSGLSLGGMTSYKIIEKYSEMFNGVIFYAPAFKMQFGKFTIGLVKTLNWILPRWAIIKSK